ncbi:hypothetical protein [Methanobrevibacter sp.]|uniref:hypothetical protein n=1 Tax=Methanobrevibacter sp. TaxID=66852 RepID=UPI003866A7E0
MKNEIFGIAIVALMLLLSISAVSAHGADLTEDTMIMANESNGILAKAIVDDLGLDVKVYKYASDGDVEHQLEHALTNPNKRILAISYQDTVNKYLDEHPELKNRVIVSDDDNESISAHAQKLVEIDVGNNSSSDFATPLIVGIIIGAIIGLIAGVFIMKRKIN